MAAKHAPECRPQAVRVKLIECVPNFSEGRDLKVIATIRDEIAAVPDVSVLHVTSDASHNRSVITFVAPIETMADAALAAIRAARDNIDLTRHHGVHPRIGAADVVPFVPLDGATMADCVALAREVGRRVGEELAIPVYLYEQAATNPRRRNLSDIRKGGFETLRNVVSSDSSRMPDFGPAVLHPTAGAVAIGARSFLVAFNVYIGDTSAVPTARDIARAVRESNGGLPGVRALGLEVAGQAQVSMNLVDIERTSLATTYAAVEHEAITRGVTITWSEIIGLVPESVAFDITSRAIRLRDNVSDHILERALHDKRPQASLRDFIASVGNSTPAPGGGSAAAISGALAAALARMVAGLTIDRPQYAGVADEMRMVQDRADVLIEQLESLAQRDATAYALVVDARKLPSDSAPNAATRDATIRDALLAATLIPLEICRVTEQTVHLCEIVAERGNQNAITDSGTAANLASAACTGSSYNVRVNARALQALQGRRDMASDAASMATEALSLARSAADAAERISRRVESLLQA